MINTAAGEMDSYEHPDYKDATWDDDNDPATPQRPWPDVYRRYATDVRRIDDAVGDLMQLLRDLKIDQNTVVIFSSDNGPSIESYLKGKDANGFSYSYRPDFFHSFGPFDGIKRDCWEGGVRMPTMARWPGHIPAGAINTTPCGAWDWLATVVDFAGQPAPARSDGVSLVPTLTGSGQQTPSSVYVEYFQNGKTPNFDCFVPAHRGRKRGQMQIVRLGDYLGVRYNIASADDDFEIYNVTKDPQEAHNLAGQPKSAGLQKKLKEAALRQRMPSATAARPYDATPVPAIEEGSPVAGVEWSAFAGEWPWLPKFDAMTPSASGEAPQPALQAVPIDNMQRRVVPRTSQCAGHGRVHLLRHQRWAQLPADSQLPGRRRRLRPRRRRHGRRTDRVGKRAASLPALLRPQERPLRAEVEIRVVGPRGGPASRARRRLLPPCGRSEAMSTRPGNGHWLFAVGVT